ncbi:sulfite exporter TauE/SafE family protein [Tateyamaria sp. SN6-1]|uniref:sulfite exporter TauE/SafE family protein n=1 Tax=Tateyamaria sp. SN6-1 TaxID=3092148 RepID=UPI0039F61745
MPDLSLIAFATLVLLLAGTVKGFIGLGMPTVALALLTLQLDARAAVTLVVVPMLLSNVWQFWRGPDRMGCVRQHWRYAVILAMCVAATVWASQSVPDRVLRGVLGAFVLVFCFFSWRNMVPDIPPHRVRVFEAISAVIAGLVGGLTAAWAPPLAMYLTGLRLDRDAFVQALGFLITAGSLSIFVMYVAVGHSTGPDLALSAYLLIPALAGFTLGERVRHRTNPELFKKVFLGAFAVLGVNLLVGSLAG